MFVEEGGTVGTVMETSGARTKRWLVCEVTTTENADLASMPVRGSGVPHGRGGRPGLVRAGR